MTRQRLTHTPFMDGWRDRLAETLATRGARTDLARFLASHYGQGIQVGKNLVARIQKEDFIPNAETALAVSHWIALRTDGPATRRAARNKRGYE